MSDFYVIARNVGPSGRHIPEDLFVSEDNAEAELARKNNAFPSGQYKILDSLRIAFDIPLNSDRRSATLTSIRNQPALKFTNGGGSNANDSAEWCLKAPRPPGASGFNLSLIWVPENTATGFVKFRITIDTFKEGVALNALPTKTENFDTTDKSYTSEIVVKELLKYRNDVRKHFKLKLQRRDGPDTLNTDIFVLGLSLRYI